MFESRGFLSCGFLNSEAFKADSTNNVVLNAIAENDITKVLLRRDVSVPAVIILRTELIIGNVDCKSSMFNLSDPNCRPAHI